MNKKKKCERTELKNYWQEEYNMLKIILSLPITFDQPFESLASFSVIINFF